MFATRAAAHESSPVLDSAGPAIRTAGQHIPGTNIRAHGCVADRMPLRPTTSRRKRHLSDVFVCPADVVAEIQQGREEVPFAGAERDLHRAARDGLAARLCWEGVDHPIDQLTREVLLPAAAAGLDAWGVDPTDRDRYLGVIEERVRRGRTGAAWQTGTVRYIEEHGRERVAALHEMTRRYVEYAHTGAPVHEWPMP